MERVGQVTKSASALVLAKLVTSAMMFLLAIVVNRRLGPEIAGVYVYAMTLYTIFQVIPDFGIGNIFIRDVSPRRGRMRRYLKNVAAMRILLGVLSFVLLMVANVLTTLLQRSDILSATRFWAVFAVSFCLLLEQPFSNSLAEAFIALERQTVVAYVYLVMGFLRVGLSLYVVLSGAKHAVVLLIVVYIVTIIYSIFHFYIVYHRWLRREGFSLAASELEDPVGGEQPVVMEDPSPFAVAVLPERIEPPEPSGTGMDTALWRYILRSAWPLAVAVAGVVMYAGLDIPMVGWLAGDKAMGLYNAGAMYSKAFIFLTIAVNMAILPAISMVADRRPERLGRVWESILRYALLLVIPLTVVVPIVARPVLMLQEHDFLQAWIVVWLTMAAMNFTMLTAISYPFFIVINMQKRIVQVVAAGVVAKITINLVTISTMGYRGAAVTVLVTEVLAFLIMYYLLSRYMDHRGFFLRFAAVPAALLLVLYGAAFALQKAFMSSELTASAGYAILISVIIVLIYAALVFLTRSVTRGGLNELNEMLKVD